jgi:hypothetical protein
MATLTQVRERIAATLADVEGLSVVPYPPESPPSVLPALVVGDASGQLAEGDARRGLDIWDFTLVLLVQMGDYALAAEALDEYLVRSGPKSIRQWIEEDPRLGLTDGTTAYLDRVENVGPRESSDGVRLMGADLHLTVRTSG